MMSFDLPAITVDETIWRTSHLAVLSPDGNHSFAIDVEEATW